MKTLLATSSGSRQPRKDNELYQAHPSFKSLPNEAVLWRYLDFTKFVSMLDKSALFFTRADKLGDPFEGSMPNANTDWLLMLQKDVAVDLHSKLSTFRRNFRNFIMVNCWHNNDHESAGMWSLYSRERDGVAIKTDVESFKRCFKTDEAVYIGNSSCSHCSFTTSGRLVR